MGEADDVPIDPWMCLSNGQYWVARCMSSEMVLGASLARMLDEIRHCPFVMCVCIVEGCGLIADSQA